MPTLDDDRPFRRFTPAQTRMIALALTIAVACTAYRLIVHGHLEQSALLFIGIPTILAVLLATAGPARTLVGGTVRGICFFLLLSGPLLGEGFICILMAAPIFLLVGVIIAALIQNARRKPDAALGCLILFLPMCLEGTIPQLSFNRIQTVTQTAIVDGTSADVQQRLSHSPQLALKVPGLLWHGFPRPVAASGEGLAPGAERRVRFAGGEGMPGDLVLRVVEAGPTSIRFAAVSDQSKIAHWLGWRTADVSWQPVTTVANPQTRVTWTFTYERRLDPAWYFAPWERYAVATAAQYLIATNAGPR